MQLVESLCHNSQLCLDTVLSYLRGVGQKVIHLIDADGTGPLMFNLPSSKRSHGLRSRLYYINNCKSYPDPMENMVSIQSNVDAGGA